MIELVISGGQSGADVCGWRVARHHGIPTGGWMPAGWLTEEGPRPGYAALFNALEHSGGYPQRTRRNVQDAGAILWFGSSWSAGAKATFNAARAMGKPVVIVNGLAENPPATVAERLRELAPSALMIAGNRASKATIADRDIEDHLGQVLALLGFPAIEADR